MLGNYFKENSKTIKTISLTLKSFLGTISMAAFIQGDPKLAFWVLFAGAALDSLLNLMPPDDKLKTPVKMIIILAMLSLLLGGCKIIKPKEITTIKDSVSIKYKTIDIPVKGAKVYQRVNVDSLKAAWQALQKSGQPTASKPTTITDLKSKAELKVWIDKYGNLQASCESKDQTIQTLVAELTRTREKLTEKQSIIKETPKWNYIAMSVMATLIVLLLIINLITFKRK